MLVSDFMRMGVVDTKFSPIPCYDFDTTIVEGFIKNIQEKWYTLRRYHCKEGFIDYWQGDSADHPDNEKKSGYNLNSTSSYYRLNGEGKWISRRDARGMFERLTPEAINLFSSHEIWMDALTDLTRRTTGFSREDSRKILEAVIDRKGDLTENIFNYARHEFPRSKLA